MKWEGRRRIHSHNGGITNISSRLKKQIGESSDCEKGMLELIKMLSVSTKVVQEKERRPTEF